MTFSDKLTEIMQRKGITAQDISKGTFRQFSVNDIRNYQSGKDVPEPWKVKYLSEFLNIDVEKMIMNSVPDSRPKPISPIGIEITSLGEVNKISKPGKQVKPAKIHNSIIRIHKIPKPGSFICSHCRVERPDCDYAHPEDEYIKFMFGGKGIGFKTPDEIVALLCFNCKKTLDMKPNKESNIEAKLEHAILWSRCIIFTQAMRIAELERKRK
jgi:hypothetical protein